MSDFIHHECGIALVRLLKPLEFYLSKYGTPFYGLNKLHLLMQKQHNRGQDGAGIASIKFNLEPGNRFINRIRSNANGPIRDIFNMVGQMIKDLEERHPQRITDVTWLKQKVDILGEMYLGHLRYGTYGKNNILNLHPLIRENNWMTKNLVLAGNFNMTNVDELFNKLIDLGQYPVETSDTITILEKIGHFLDEENEELYQKFKSKGYPKRSITHHIAKNLNVQKILRRAAKTWDGGYVIAGMFGHGDAFVMRDPSGIRPAFYYYDEEIVVVTSERPAIQTALNIFESQITELKPGHALIIKKEGKITEKQIHKPVEKRSCSFERIYFSRGTDFEIYRERKKLGNFLAPAILRAIDHDIENTVFSYIPNTAIDAYYGLIEEVGSFCDKIKIERILETGNDLNRETLNKIFNLKPRAEKVAVKDVKLRTFITQDSQRDDLAAHVYDITYGSIRRGIDNLVVLDDSIVRGTTLKQSILRILDRLGPRRIVIASSAPQIRYPDCYGIDMARISDFIAFKAAIELLKETNQEHVINEVYRKSKLQEQLPKEKIVNFVKEIYQPFSPDRISSKISALLTPANCRAQVQIVYQTIEDLHNAIPDHKGDWYFTGDYPTPGGNKVVNKAFINYIEGRNVRAY
ncbi:MAG: amidophosphoribosyltransferase [Bacteroidales bacterium]|nr:amidophosphoribosyltransferase [Bacteroidales bacterium]HNW73440.1 amidophosphoribosyltransferase [Bacteroidales bacterium]HPS49411.1 amidophosphoribosyltransferase [Bacteroidales bacterium]